MWKTLFRCVFTVASLIVEPLGDLGVLESEGDQADDLALARRQRLGIGLGQACGQLALQRGREPDVSLAHGAERLDQGLHGEALEHHRARAGTDRRQGFGRDPGWP